MKEYQTIIFDLDGTLSNSKEGITKSVQYALQKLGIVENDLKELEHFIGPPLIDEFIKCYGFDEETAKKGLEYYRERYVPIGIYETKSYDGVDTMLQNLKKCGKTLAIATSKPQPMAEEVLKYLNIYEYFDYIMGAELVGPRQSKTAVLLELLREMKDADKSEMLMVGDTCFDINGAKNVGIDAMGVSYGVGDGNEMISHGAVFVADNTREITEYICRF